MGENVKVYELFRATNGAIVQNGYIDSDPIELEKVKADGFFSLHMVSVGGTITVTVLVCSTKSGTYIAPTTPVVIFSAKAAGSYFDSFDPPPTPFMKIRFTETNVAAVTSLDAWCNVQ